MHAQPGLDSSPPTPPVVSIPGAVRPLVVVAGALIALQSSQGFDIPKLALFVVTVLAVAGSVRHAWRTRDSILVATARPWLIASAIIAAIVGLSLPVALANGTAVGTWIRDAAPYVLVAAAPWLALDLGASVSPSVATWATAVAGSLATASFTINWVQRRGLVDLPIDRLVLPSFTLAAAFFALAVARSVWGGRDRFAWAAVAAVVIGLLLTTGTRTSFTLAAIPVVLLVDAFLIGGRARLRTAVAPAAVPLLLMAVLVLPGLLQSLTTRPAGPTGADVAVGSGAPAGPPRPGDSADGLRTAEPGPAATPVATVAAPDPGRFGTIDDVVTGTDQSLRFRWLQTVAAWHIFIGSPLVGRGLGVPIPWIDWNGQTVAEFSSDTPFAVLAKFGLFGIVIWASLAWAAIVTLPRLRRYGVPGSIARSALLGFAVGLVVLAPFGPQLEDKGTGLALILLLGLAIAVVRTTEPAEAGPPADG